MPAKVQNKPNTKTSKGVTKPVKKCPTKAALKTGDLGSYRKLLRQTGDGTKDRDHIPSNAALQAAAATLAKRKLTKPEKDRVKKAGQAIVIPKTLHKAGRTYGGKNTKAQSSGYATDLAKAAKNDIEAYKKSGADKSILKLMKKMPKSNAEYDQMLLDAINDT